MGARWGGLGDDRTWRLRPVSFLSLFNTCFVYFLQNDFFSPHYRLGCEAVGGVGEVSSPCPCSIHSQERILLGLHPSRAGAMPQRGGGGDTNSAEHGARLIIKMKQAGGQGGGIL